MAPSRPKALAPGALVANNGIYTGYSLRETAGAAAVVRLWDNPAAASGTILATIALAANASKDASVLGVWFTGVFVEIVSGTVEGSVYIG